MLAWFSCLEETKLDHYPTCIPHLTFGASVVFSQKFMWLLVCVHACEQVFVNSLKQILFRSWTVDGIFANSPQTEVHVILVSGWKWKTRHFWKHVIITLCATAEANKRSN
jgi:hypothetical protein